VICLEDLMRPRLLRWRPSLVLCSFIVLAIAVVLSFSRAATANLVFACIVTVLVYALRSGGADVQVWNRTHARAQALVAELGGRAVERLEQAELLVNCTAAGLHDQAATFKHLPIGADEVEQFAFVVDLVYTSLGDTALIAAARQRGSVTVDGLEVLVHQGALSFEGWTGCAAPIAAMREGARGR